MQTGSHADCEDLNVSLHAQAERSFSKLRVRRERAREQVVKSSSELFLGGVEAQREERAKGRHVLWC